MKRALLSLCALLVAFAPTACRRPATSAEEAGAKSAAMWDQVARALAVEAKAAGAKGGRVLLVRSSKAAVVAGDHDAIEAGLRRELGGDALVVVAAADAPRPAGADEFFPTLPLPLNLKWLAGEVEARKPLAAVISLTGAPAGGAPPAVPLVCFAPAAGDELKDLIRKGVVRAAVATARNVPPKEEDWFKIRFLVLRADNVDAW